MFWPNSYDKLTFPQVKTLIDSLKQLRSAPTKEFCEEARLQFLSSGMNKRLQLYILFEALFNDGENNGILNAKAFEAKKEVFSAFCKDNKVQCKEIMWGLELYVHLRAETDQQASLKASPLVCKALYDEDLLGGESGAAFIEYYEQGAKVNGRNPGHDAVHAKIGAFVDWLRESDSDDDSDSD